MDKRISYKIVLDCETAPCDKDIQAVSPWNMFVYDVGWAVVDKRGNVYKKHSFVNADIFLAEKELMKSAYYRKKIPEYWEQIKSGDSILTSFHNIWRELKNDIAEYGVKEIYAHNALFDYGALTNTQRWLTKSKYRYFFPRDIEICDTLKMARQVIAKQKTFKEWCHKNHLPVSCSAENLYKYLKRDLDFKEEHKGLDDVMIEKDIMAMCFKQHKKMERRLWTD